MAKEFTIKIGTDALKTSYNLGGAETLNIIDEKATTKTNAINYIKEHVSSVQATGNNLILTLKNTSGEEPFVMTLVNAHKLKEINAAANGVKLSPNTLADFFAAYPDAVKITAYKGTTVTGSFYHDIINMLNSDYVVPDSGKSKGKGLTINAGAGNDNITGTIGDDTINGGDGDDIINSSAGNDVITGGLGKNTINYKKGDGNDVINLTKGENLTINLSGSGDDISVDNLKFEYNKNDFRIYTDKNNNTEYITLKNFASKDVTNNAGRNTSDTSSVELLIGGSRYNLRSNQKDGNYWFEITPTGNFTGGWQNDHINASAAAELKDKKDNHVDMVLNGGAGNDLIESSMFADKITGGTGANVIKYTSLTQLDGDKIYLTKGEQLNIDISNIADTTQTYKVNGKDLDVTVTKGGVSKTFKIMNFGMSDVTNNKTSKTEDTSWVKLNTSSEVIDLRTVQLAQLDIDKNYTGTWRADNISAKEYKIYTDKLKTEVSSDYTKRGLTISGGLDNDVIIGSDYSDTINGGDGDDIIIGGLGNDIITGGKGNNKVILEDTYGDDKIITTKGETVNITLNRNINQLEYILDGKNVKAVMDLPNTSYYLRGLVYLSIPMKIDDNTYCTIDSNIEDGRVVKIYNASQIEVEEKTGVLKLKEGATAIRKYSSDVYTKFTVVEENGEYKWRSDNILEGGKELYLYTEPRQNPMSPKQLDDVWTSFDFDYTIMNSAIFRVETTQLEDGETVTKEIDVSKDAAKQLGNGSYDITAFFGEKDKLKGSFSIANMAPKKLDANVLINGANLEEYLTTKGHLSVTGSKKLTGTRFNDVFTGSKLNDTITGGLGNNLYEIDTTTDFGNDTVILTKNEAMTLDFDAYNIKNLKYELVNGGKDIKISSNVNAGALETFEIRATLHPVWISTSDGNIIEEGDPEDGAYEAYEVVFKVVEENGEYKWMSGNILKDVAPDADPITFELPLAPLDLEFANYDSMFHENYPGYEYTAGDIDLDNYVCITVDAIKAYKIVNGEETDISNDISQQLIDGDYDIRSYYSLSSLRDFVGTVTLKDFGQKDLGATVNIGNKDLTQYLMNEGIIQASGKGRIAATRFNDNIIGSASADTIYSYAGKDTINAGQGNDRIYLGAGDKTLSFKSGDGNDIIYSANLAGSVKLNISGYDKIEYLKKGDALVITSTDNDGKTVNNKKIAKLYITTNGDLSTVAKDNTLVEKTLYKYKIGNTIKYSIVPKIGAEDVSNRQFFLQDGKIVLEATHQETLFETITVDGFFKNFPNIVVNNNALVTGDLFNGRAFTYGTTLDYKSAQTFNGTKLREEFIGGKGNDRIYTGSGTDIVTAGEGNDTIYLDGAGSKTVNFVKGDGNDTIYMNYDGVNANFVFKDCVIGAPSAGKGSLTFEKKANDLCIVRDYGDIKTKQTTTVKGYFANKTTSKLTVNGRTPTVNSKMFTVNADVISSEVAAWSSNNKDADIAQVLPSSASDNIAELLKLYQPGA